MKKYTNVTMGSLALLGVLSGFSFAPAYAQTNTSPWPSSGNVGIGTPNPQAKLHVAAGVALISGNTDLNYPSGFYFAGSSGLNRELRFTQPGLTQFAIQATDSGGTSMTDTTLSLQPWGGNVGIGVLAPWAKLDVNGSIAIDDFSTLAFRHSQGTGAYAIHYANVGPRYPLRFVGSSDSTTHRYFEFGNYTGENQANTWNPTVVIDSFSGVVGVGTASPSAKLDVYQGITPVGLRVTSVGDANIRLNDGSYEAAEFRNNGTASTRLVTMYARFLELGTLAPQPVIITTASSERLRIDASGNVGIGTTTPTQKLSVNGTVRAKEVVVETTGWSDYVLKEGYQLPSLSDVEQHIKQHGTLPNIPSEAQVAESGIGVGEMETKLLAKVEELTLHAIQQEKTLDAALNRIDALERENRSLRRSESQ